jgi:hypothetical protein
MEDIYPVREPDAMRMELPDGSVAEYPEQTIHALTEIALRNSVGYFGAIALSIADEKFLLDQERLGSKLIIA